jgi:hypothetical protein
VHLFWWLAPLIVGLAYYGDAIARRLGYLFDWKARTGESDVKDPSAGSGQAAGNGQSAGASVT